MAEETAIDFPWACSLTSVNALKSFICLQMRNGQGTRASQVTVMLAYVRKTSMLSFRSWEHITGPVLLCGRRACLGRRSHPCVQRRIFVPGENIVVFPLCLATSVINVSRARRPSSSGRKAFPVLMSLWQRLTLHCTPWRY